MTTTRTTRTVRSTLALAVATLPWSAAWAQGTPAPSTELQTITVTAQKREQPAQQVGVAISVLSGDELAARGVRKVNALQNEVPSLEIEPAFGGGQAQFRLRGVGFQDYATNNAGAVTVYVDEVAFPLGVQTQGLLFDVDRVEVLRGPQGTLYGRNTTGGAVNFITRAPTKKFEAAGLLGFGSFGAVEAEGYASGALSDTLRGRVSLATQQGGGWQVNRATGEKLGDKNIIGLRGQLALDAMPDLKFSLKLHYGRDKSEGQGLYVFVAQPAVPTPAYPVAKPATPADSDLRKTGWGFAPAFLAAIGQPANAKPNRDNNTVGASITAQWDIGALRLTSITAADKFKRKELADYDAQALPLAETYFDSSSQNFSQELRVASNTPADALTWVAGAYFANEKLDEKYWSSFANSFGFPTVLTAYTQKVNTGSVFGQADYKFFDELKLVLGLRQERETRKRENFSTGSVGASVLDPNGVTFTGPTSGDFSANHSSGKLGLDYQLRKAVLTYASISRGVKSGGFTAYNTFNETALTPFKPEVLIAYEAGFKSDLSRSLRVNAAVYHYDYRDQQILDAIKDPTTGATVGKIVNAPRSTIDGIDIEFAWKASSEITVTQFLGYKTGKFKDYTALSPAGDLSGQDLYFPKLSWGGAFAYRTTIAGFGVGGQFDASYHDKTRSFLNRINPAYDFNTAAYWLANARVELAPVDAKWSATLYVRNLADKKYDVTRNFFDLPLPVAAAGAPRTFGVQAKYEF
jgi:iron complex outermembrane recepter protein